MTIEQIKQKTESSRQAAINAILSHAGEDGQRQQDQTNQALRDKLNSAYQGSFTLVPIAGDGDCFFRALADQLVTRYPKKTLQIYSDLNLDQENTDFAMVLKKLAVGGLQKIGENDRAKDLSGQTVQAQAKDMTVLAVLLGIDIVPVSLDNTAQVDQVILSQSNEDPRPTVFLAHSAGHYSSLQLIAEIPQAIKSTINDSIDMRSDLGNETYYQVLEMNDPASLAQRGSMQRVYSLVAEVASQSAPSHSGGGGGGGAKPAAAAQSAQPSAAARSAPSHSGGGGGAAPAAKAPELTWEEQKKAEQETKNKPLIIKLSSNDKKYYDQIASTINKLKDQNLRNEKDKVQLGYLENGLQEWLEAKSADVKKIKIGTISDALTHFQSKLDSVASGNSGGGAKMGSSSQGLTQKEIVAIYEHFFPKSTLNLSLTTAPEGETREAQRVRNKALSEAKFQIRLQELVLQRFITSVQSDNSPDAVFKAMEIPTKKNMIVGGGGGPHPYMSDLQFQAAATANMMKRRQEEEKNKQLIASPSASIGGGGGGAKMGSSSQELTEREVFDKALEAIRRPQRSAPPSAHGMSAASAAKAAASGGGGGGGGTPSIHTQSDRLRDLQSIIECPVLKYNYHTYDRLQLVFDLFFQMKRLEKYFPSIKEFKINSGFSFDIKENIKNHNITFEDVMRELKYWMDMSDKSRETNIYSSACDRLADQVKAFTDKISMQCSDEIEVLKPKAQKNSGGAAQTGIFKSQHRIPAPHNQECSITQEETSDKVKEILDLLRNLVPKHIRNAFVDFYNSRIVNPELNISVFISEIQMLLKDSLSNIEGTGVNQQVLQDLQNRIDNLGNPPERHAPPQPR